MIRLGFLDVAGLKQYQPEIVVPFGKLRVFAHKVAKNVRGRGGIVVLAHGQP